MAENASRIPLDAWSPHCWLMNRDWHGFESTTVIVINTRPITNSERALAAKIRRLRAAEDSLWTRLTSKLYRSDIDALCWQNKNAWSRLWATPTVVLDSFSAPVLYSGQPWSLKLRWKNTVDFLGSDQEPRMLGFKEHFIAENNKEVIQLRLYEHWIQHVHYRVKAAHSASSQASWGYGSLKPRLCVAESSLTGTLRNLRQHKNDQECYLI